MNIPIVPRVLRIWGNLNVVVVNIVVVGLSASAITSAIYLYDDNARYDEALLEPRIPKKVVDVVRFGAAHVDRGRRREVAEAVFVVNVVVVFV